MAIKFVLLSLLGGILGLDRVFIQLQVSRPIVSAPLTGLILGDAYTGLIVGALLELFWIERLQIGTCVPPNDFFVALLVVSSSIMAGERLGHMHREMIAFSILLYIPFGYLGKMMDSFIVKSNDGLYEGALRDAERAAIGGICLRHMTGLAKVFISSVGFILVSLPFGVAVIVYAFPLLPPAFLKALTMTSFAIPLLGVAAGLNTINLKRAIPIFSALFLAISLIMELINYF
ncbi:MAG: PTS sugar transporter subunit IIC [Syntrophales bacterium LBB04]|nr:PTS sugar transporter subunit IIC [Syntrophales bacterium LBB04]